LRRTTKHPVLAVVQRPGAIAPGTPAGDARAQTLWSRVPPALQLPLVFRAAVGREVRRTRVGGIAIKSAVAVFG
jgi:hypothetical protein